MSEPEFNRSFGSQVTFYYTPWWEHLFGLFRRPWTIAVRFAAALAFTGTVWRLIGPAIGANGAPVWALACVVSIAALAAVALSIRDYLSEVPEGLENASVHAKRIAVLRPVKWEYRLAKSLLAAKLGPLDKECKALLDGTVFVEGRQIRDLAQYCEWLESRSSNLIRLTRVFEEVMVGQFPTSICSIEGKEASPTEVAAACESVADLFRSTVEIERAAHETIPPEGWEKLHSLQLRWSDPFRIAIMQTFPMLQRIIDADPKSDESIDLCFELGDVPNIDAFGAELDRLHRCTFG